MNQHAGGDKKLTIYFVGPNNVDLHNMYKFAKEVASFMHSYSVVAILHDLPYS